MNKVLTGLVAAVVLIMAAVSNLIYGMSEETSTSGKCGKNSVWSFNQTYTVTIPISTIENKLNKTPYGIRLQTGDIGKSQVSIVSLKLID